MYTKLTTLEKSDNNDKVIAVQNGILTAVGINSLIPNGDVIDY
jgi:hypothetical protein